MMSRQTSQRGPLTRSQGSNECQCAYEHTIENLLPSRKIVRILAILITIPPNNIALALRLRTTLFLISHRFIILTVLLWVQRCSFSCMACTSMARETGSSLLVCWSRNKANVARNICIVTLGNSLSGLFFACWFAGQGMRFGLFASQVIVSAHLERLSCMLSYE